jgi:hypothetical protein
MLFLSFSIPLLLEYRSQTFCLQLRHCGGFSHPEGDGVEAVPPEAVQKGFVKLLQPALFDIRMMDSDAGSRIQINGVGLIKSQKADIEFAPGVVD